MLRAFAVLALGALWALSGSATAWGHATLAASNPANDAVLKSAPSSVTLRFDEPVETVFGALRVYDTRGRRVDDGGLRQPSGDSIAVSIDRVLARGSYTVAWRVVSADTHPVHGAFVFSVGARSAGGQAEAARIEAGQATPRSISAGFGVARFLALVLVLAAAGGAIALALVLTGAPLGVQRRVELVLALASLALLPLTLAGLVYEAAAAGGFGLREAADTSVLRSVLDTRFGTVWAVRAGLAVLLALILLAGRRLAGPSPSWLKGCAALCGACLAVSTTWASHANVEGSFAMVADGAHVLAAAIWTGGLLAVVLALRSASASERWPLAAHIVPRFSALAVGSVAVLVLAGIGSAYIEVGAWRGLWETTYGRLVLGKAALLLPLLALGAFNNRVAVPRLRRGIATPQEQRRFIHTVVAELCLMVAVLALTAALVEQRPAKASVAGGGLSSVTAQAGPYELDLVVDPARVGHNQIHLYLLDRSGQPARGIAEVRLAASLTSPSLGPLRSSTTPAGPGHFIAEAAQFPIAGNWRLTTQVRRGEFDQWSVTTTLLIH